jgi:hypothetical protein
MIHKARKWVELCDLRMRERMKKVSSVVTAVFILRVRQAATLAAKILI